MNRELLMTFVGSFVRVSRCFALREPPTSHISTSSSEAALTSLRSVRHLAAVYQQDLLPRLKVKVHKQAACRGFSGRT